MGYRGRENRLRVILVAGFLCVTAALTFGIAAPAWAQAPANDDFADATDLGSTLPQTVEQDLFDSTREVGEPTSACVPPAESGSGTVWFSFTPLERAALTIDSKGSPTYNVLAVFRGSSMAELTEVACNRSASYGLETRSRVSLLVEPGITYSIQVTNRGSFLSETNAFFMTLDKRLMHPGVVRKGEPPCQSAGENWYPNTGFDAVGEGPACVQRGDHRLPGVWRGRADVAAADTGLSTPGVRNASLWILKDDFDCCETLTVGFGRGVDLPVVGDIDGDGLTDIGVAQGNKWFFDVDLDGVADAEHSLAYGSVGDLPLLGDWDADGTASVGVRRGNVFMLDNTSGDGVGDVVYAFGKASDRALVADWDGDGAWTVAVVRGNQWFIDVDGDAKADLIFEYGKASDVPIAGHWGF